MRLGTALSFVWISWATSWPTISFEGTPGTKTPAPPRASNRDPLSAHQVASQPELAAPAPRRQTPCVGPEEFRRAGHELVDWVADYRLRVEDLPVRAQVAPGDVLSALAPGPPEAPEPLAALIADLDRVIVPGLTHTQHPGNFAWFPSNASLSSVLGDIVAGGLGALGLSWQSAPALTELEQVVCDWARQLCGLSADWKGTITDGASTACLVALLVARERATDGCQRRGGLQAETGTFDGLLLGRGAFVGGKGRAPGRLRSRQPAPGPRQAPGAGDGRRRPRAPSWPPTSPAGAGRRPS